MDRELQAAVLIDKAQKNMRARQFDLAREQLGKAFELSVMARNDIGELVQLTRKYEGEARYKSARDLEVLGKKSEALAAYEALVKDWPNGLSDEQARCSSLRVDIAGAEKAWSEAEAAEAAGEPQKALEAYLESERFYAGWKDGKARIARLREAMAPKPEGAGSTPAAGNGGS
jgi:tetratricopeptide (TPR) repeat protein